MSGANVKERARKELQEYAVVASYLYVCFAAFLLYKSALLQGENVGLVPHGVAVIKALVLGKFILIGEAVGIGTRVPVTRLLGAIVTRSVLMLLLLVALSVLEELLVGRVHGRSFAQTLAEFERNSVREMLAKCLLMLLVLVPLIGAKEFSRALGPGVLRRMLLESRSGG